MYKIMIKTDNEAFGEFPEVEVARILRKLADKIETNGGLDDVSLMDVNGNKVGKAEEV